MYLCDIVFDKVSQSLDYVTFPKLISFFNSAQHPRVVAEEITAGIYLT